MKKTLLLAAGALMFAVLNVTLAAPAPSAYDVEIVVFENRMPELEGSELWTNTDAPIAELAQAVPPGDAPSSNPTLANAVAALEHDGRYHVLTYKRWRQSAEERSATKPVKISDENGQLDGIFRFYISRFLHVDIDLAMQALPIEAGNSYRLTERRRIKTQETNYFDHPKLGALVRITPVDKE